MTTTVIYPAKPQNVDESVIRPSPAFKQEVFKVLGVILFFIFVYFALMAVAILLAILLGYGGIMLVAAIPKLFTIIIGLGLVGVGCMTIFFLLKFLFKTNKTDRSNLIEVKEHEQPELFSFVRKITEETRAPFPKRIYLSADVNASVFYDSSFWSMFFPVRKNLQIGLGLVNSVNVSEFKAILAHEFGHFSQRSMKLGSYVYNVNRVIYNMLYDNEGYGKTLESWASVHAYFYFFAMITSRIVVGIQFILQQVYGVVNKSYMSLSRQMEFHADAVAAYVSGGDHLVTSLRRLDVANHCYNLLFNYYGMWHKENLKADNLYTQHFEMMKLFAGEQGLPIINGLPQVTAQSFAHFNRARVVIKDQWASHPSTDDREEHLNKLNIHTPVESASPWPLFRDAEKLQKDITDNIYADATFKDTPQTLDLAEFRERYTKLTDRYRINKRYKGFFTSRDITEFDPSTIEKEFPADTAASLEDLLDETTIALPQFIEGIKTDLQVLEGIKNRTIGVKTYEFNGMKYKYDDSYQLISTLQNELPDTEQRLKEADKRMGAFFIRKAIAQGHGDKLKADYQVMFAARKKSDEDIKQYISILETLQPVYNTVSIDMATAIVKTVKEKETTIKARLREMMQDDAYTSHCTEADKEKINEYLSKERDYFSLDVFHNEELALFHEAMNIYHALAYDHAFAHTKQLLERQLEFA